MKSEAKNPRNTQGTKVHLCQRHHDLTILLKRAKAPICNHCFATLKKSYFNVIAGLLLEQHYLHSVTKGLLEFCNHVERKHKEVAEAVLNLQAEITELKKGAPPGENSRPEPTHHTVPDAGQTPGQEQDTRPAELSPGGHVPRVRFLLSKQTQARIARFRALGNKKNAQACPKTDDLQDSSTYTPGHQTKSTGQIISETQDKE